MCPCVSLCFCVCAAPPRGPRAPPMGEASPANWRWQLSIKRRPAINHPPLPERRRQSLWRMDGSSRRRRLRWERGGWQVSLTALPGQKRRGVLQPRLYLQPEAIKESSRLYFSEIPFLGCGGTFLDSCHSKIQGRRRGVEVAETGRVGRVDSTCPAQHNPSHTTTIRHSHRSHLPDAHRCRGVCLVL